MSSNDKLIIIEKKDGFNIHHNLCVDNDFCASKKNLITKCKELRAAIIKAQKICNTYPYVEYGYSIELIKRRNKK